MRPRLLAALLAVLCACRKAEAPPAPVAPEPAPAAMPSPPVEVPNMPAEFALDAYRRFAADKKGNLFFSPYSISSALAMTYAGAAGRTKDEMSKALRFERHGDTLHEDFGALTAALNALGAAGQVKLSVANALWAQKDYAFREEFLGVAAKSYGAGVRKVDFMADPNAARAVINGWVEDATEKRIKDLIPEGVLAPLTKLVLTNAVYFKGQWLSRFKEAATQNAPFTNGDGAAVEAPLMFQAETFPYTEDRDLQILELPYRGGEVAMTVLLPRRADGLPALEKSLSPEALAGWLSRLQPTEARVHLPRFKVETSLALIGPLRALGMKSAFENCELAPPERCADFSAMSGNRELYISAALHKAFVEVNEEGTEAAAATAVVMTASESVSQIVEFRADRPFLFLIRHRRSGAVLFMGRLTHPGA